MTNPTIASKAYKFVDLAYADDVAQGALKIGTLRSYANLEALRKDSNDGAKQVNLPHFLSDRPEEIASFSQKMGPFGFGFGKDTQFLSFDNNIFRHEYQNCFCFCMSRSQSWPPVIERDSQALFEISNIRTLTQIFVSEIKEHIQSAFIGNITYEPQSHLNISSDLTPSPWTKDSIFDWENEVRIIMDPDRNMYKDPENIEPIFIKPHSEIAALFTRIR